jgi:hypothetical protein
MRRGTQRPYMHAELVGEDLKWHSVMQPRFAFSVRAWRTMVSGAGRRPESENPRKCSGYESSGCNTHEQSRSPIDLLVNRPDLLSPAEPVVLARVRIPGARDQRYLALWDVAS